MFKRLMQWLSGNPEACPHCLRAYDPHVERWDPRWAGYELVKDDWFEVVSPDGCLLYVDHLDNLDDYELEGSEIVVTHKRLWGVRYYTGDNKSDKWYLFDNYSNAEFFAEDGMYEGGQDEYYARMKASSVRNWL